MWPHRSMVPSWYAGSDPTSWCGESDFSSWYGESSPTSWYGESSPTSWCGESCFTSWCGESCFTSWCGESCFTSWCGRLALPVGVKDVAPQVGTVNLTQSGWTAVSGNCHASPPDTGNAKASWTPLREAHTCRTCFCDFVSAWKVPLGYMKLLVIASASSSPFFLRAGVRRCRSQSTASCRCCCSSPPCSSCARSPLGCSS